MYYESTDRLGNYYSLYNGNTSYNGILNDVDGSPKVPYEIGRKVLINDERYATLVQLCLDCICATDKKVQSISLVDVLLEE